jgi:hypothetical protein
VHVVLASVRDYLAHVTFTPTTIVPRNRFKPTSRGEKVHASPSVLATLEVLTRYRYLPSNYVSVLTGFSYRYCKSGLFPRLFHEGYVFCPPEGMQSYNARYRHRIMSITPRGEVFLKEYGLFVPVRKTKQPFRHQFMGELARASFEIATREIPHLSIRWGTDILDNPRCPPTTRDDPEPFAIPVNGTTVKPDDEIVGYRYGPPGTQSSFLFFVREDDRDTEDWTTVRRKMEAYLAIQQQEIYKKRYGIPNCLFLWLTISPRRMQEMMKLLLRLTSGKGSAQFLFKMINDFASYENFPLPTGHMARDLWQRAEYPPFSMIEELGKAACN